MKLTKDMMLKPLRTRDGCKAWIVELLTNQPFPWRGCIRCRDDTIIVVEWDSNGFHLSYDTSPVDIIGEWKEPESGEFWTNVYRSQGGEIIIGPHRFYRSEADEACSQNYSLFRIACVRTRWTEGQFDEEGE